MDKVVGAPKLRQVCQQPSQIDGLALDLNSNDGINFWGRNLRGEAKSTLKLRMNDFERTHIVVDCKLVLCCGNGEKNIWVGDYCIN